MQQPVDAENLGDWQPVQHGCVNHQGQPAVDRDHCPAVLFAGDTVDDFVDDDNGALQTPEQLQAYAPGPVAAAEALA